MRKSGFETALIALAFIAALAYLSARNYFEVAAWVRQTDAALLSLGRIDQLCSDALVSYGTYLQSRNPIELEQLKKVRESQIAEIDKLLRLNLTQEARGRAEALKENVNHFFNKVNLLTKQDAPKNESITELELFRSLLQLQNEVHSFESFKNQLLAKRQQQAQEASDRTFQVIALASVLAFLFLTLALVAQRRDWREIRRHQEELIQASQEAERANRSKSEFLANMSHEIRTPMNAVLGMSAILLRSSPRPDQMNAFKIIEASGRALLNLIDGILDLSRIEAGKLKLRNSDFELRPLLTELGEMMGPSLSTQVKIGIQIDENLPERLHGDEGYLKQILINLMGNAAKFTDTGGIYLRCHCIETGPENIILRFEVEDTGVGIPEQALPHLFQPFMQVSPESAREKLGTGLGLSISKRLTEAMGGNIRVESKVGRGSRFIVEIPFSPARDVIRPTSAPLAELRYSGRALIVDDNPANLHVAEVLLHNLGLEVVTASSGSSAVALATEQSFDVILMDCQMPGMSGLEATRQIRLQETKSERKTPIIALTAFAQPESIAASESAGMDDFISKPIDFEQLMETLGRFLNPQPSCESPRDLTAKAHESAKKANTAIDFTYLEQLRSLPPPRGEFASSNEVIDELLRLYQSTCQETIQRMRQHLEANEPLEFGERAHFLKSSASSIGATGVAELLESLEISRQTGRLPVDADSKLLEVENACFDASRQLISWWAKIRGSNHEAQKTSA